MASYVCPRSLRRKKTSWKAQPRRGHSAALDCCAASADCAGGWPTSALTPFRLDPFPQAAGHAARVPQPPDGAPAVAQSIFSASGARGTDPGWHSRAECDSRLGNSMIRAQAVIFISSKHLEFMLGGQHAGPRGSRVQSWPPPLLDSVRGVGTPGVLRARPVTEWTLAWAA